MNRCRGFNGVDAVHSGWRETLEGRWSTSFCLLPFHSAAQICAHADSCVVKDHTLLLLLPQTVREVTETQIMWKPAEALKCWMDAATRRRRHSLTITSRFSSFGHEWLRHRIQIGNESNHLAGDVKTSDILRWFAFYVLLKTSVEVLTGLYVSNQKRKLLF